MWHYERTGNGKHFYNGVARNSLLPKKVSIKLLPGCLFQSTSAFSPYDQVLPPSKITLVVTGNSGLNSEP